MQVIDYFEILRHLLRSRNVRLVERKEIAFALLVANYAWVIGIFPGFSQLIGGNR